MRVKIVENVLHIHLDMVETEELEETGYIVSSYEDDKDFRVCITYSMDLFKEYQVWMPIDGYRFDGYMLKLSYNPAQENEEEF